MSASEGIFLPYQSRMMEAVNEHRVVFYEKSRRTGISWAAAFVADLQAALDPRQGGMDVFYMGYNLEMAREFIDYCAEDMAALQIVASQVNESFFRDPAHPEKDTKVFRIDLASGNKILALPSVPRALRGMQGLVIIDEAAFHDDLDELLKAALALLMWGGKVLVISTHNGDTNPFNTYIQDIRAGRRPFHLLRTTFDDALADGLYKKICEKSGEVWTEEAQARWRQEIVDFYGDAADEELFCIPSPSSGSYIPLVLIEARTDVSVPVVRWGCDAAFSAQPGSARTGEAQRFIETDLWPVVDGFDRKIPHAFGMDFGRSGDLSVIWVLALERNLVRRTAVVIELRNVPFDQQREILFWLIDRLPLFRSGKLDARGNGQYLAEVTRQRYGERIEEVMLSEPWYRENMPPMKAGLEDGTLTLPADREIRDDIRALAIVRGVARVPDKRAGEKGSQRHGDAAVALALAVAASRADPEIYGYRPAPSALPGLLDQRTRREWAVEDEIAAERAGRGRGFYGLRGSVRL